MLLKRNKVPTHKVRILVMELLGSKVLKTKSISVYEATHAEVFGVVEEAINDAADIAAAKTKRKLI